MPIIVQVAEVDVLRTLTSEDELCHLTYSAHFERPSGSEGIGQLLAVK